MVLCYINTIVDIENTAVHNKMIEADYKTAYYVFIYIKSICE